MTLHVLGMNAADPKFKGKKLKPKTLHEYRAYAKPGGPLDHAFGGMDPFKVEQDDIAQYLEYNADPPEGAKIEARPVIANREKAFFSTCFRTARRKGWLPKKANPCAGVERNTERPATALPTNKQVRETLAVLRPYHRDLLRMIEITGQRPTDIRTIEWSFVVEEPSEEDIEEGKGPRIEFVADKTETTTGRKVNIKLTAEVREILARRRAYIDEYMRKKTKRRKVEVERPKYVFVNMRGQLISQSWIGAVLREKGAGFTSQQLRPKAHTAGKKKGRDMTGHTGGMDRTYTRDIDITPLDE